MPAKEAVPNPTPAQKITDQPQGLHPLARELPGPNRQNPQTAGEVEPAPVKDSQELSN